MTLEQADYVQQVRRFNRLVAQRAGVLDESYLRRGRPLGEVRLLFEIGPGGAEVRRLRAKLGLDPGYLSRLLRSLERAGLVEVRPADGDGRQRQVRLTEIGRSEWEAYEAASDAVASAMLGDLSPKARDRLVSAMSEVEGLLRSGAIEFCPEDPGSPDALWCLDRYFGELAVRFEGGFDPGRGGAEADRAMAPPSGLFLVARRDGEPVGCGGLKLEGDIAEIKRMWVAPTARGVGLARRLLRALEEHARGSGASSLRLDTNKALTEAQSLYLREGFADVARFNDNPYAHRWFEKSLRKPSG